MEIDSIFKGGHKSRYRPLSSIEQKYTMIFDIELRQFVPYAPVVS